MASRPSTLDSGLTERRLLALAALFLLLYTLAISLSPAGRLRTWQTAPRWDVWVGFAVWLAAFALAHVQIGRWLPGHDPTLLPVAALLSGWGLLTIWRLAPDFGARQTAWLALSVAALTAGLRLPGDLNFLRRYKYLWLTGALLLTAATLLFGVNPLGFGPPMWLGCCGLYMQPSEPLKLLLIAYLAAYMADLQPILMLEDGDALSHNERHRKNPLARLRFLWDWTHLAPLLAPTLLMTGLALLILVVQRDLGAALIYMFLYAAVVYLASGRRSVLAAAAAGLLGAGLLGYRLFDVVRVRVDAWINPWLDPAGRSYQIIQSIIAIANGGVIGRGPGLGNPALVPLSHSDLVFSAISEETGLLGIIAILLLIGLGVVAGLRAALLARGPYHRYLAAGLVALLGGQSLLIIGGNLRLLPLTGVTLPFVSYGGSSLLTTFICLLLLLHISDRSGEPPAKLYRPAPYFELGFVLLIGLLACGIVAGWWTLVRNGDLLTRTDNQRRYIADRYVRRGAILDRKDNPLAISEGDTGSILRRVSYPPLSNLIGYTDPTYGQAGLEAAQDDTLRGLRGNPAGEIWWQHLLYGTSPPGLDIRLSIDMDIQQPADQALGDHRAALVALNAADGEILALASHPSFDANRLAEQHDALIADPGAPLFNRAVLGRYPIGDLAHSLFPDGLAPLGADPLPSIGLAPGDDNPPGAAGSFSPLQVAVGAGALADGVRVAPRLVTAIHFPQTGWMPLEPAAASITIPNPDAATGRLRPLAVADQPIWQTTAVVASGAVEGGRITWAVAGTLPEWTGAPYVVVVYLEEDNQDLAAEIAKSILETMMGQASTTP